MQPGAGSPRARVGRTRGITFAGLVAVGALGLATVGQNDRETVAGGTVAQAEAMAATDTPPAFGLDLDAAPAPVVAPQVAPAVRPAAKVVPTTTAARASRDDKRAASAEPPFVPPVIDSTGIPVTVLRAYLNAKHTVRAANPVCHISLSLISAIGRVESDHALGGYLDKYGRTLTPILGPRLDGHPGVKSISDSDGGLYDGDKTYDRAVGPMQFIPGTWKLWATDGNGDKIGDPSNIWDASLSAAWYLCASGRDLRDPKALKAAILSYNGSENYYKLVLAWSVAYHTAMTAIPDSKDAKAARAKAERQIAEQAAEAATRAAATKQAQAAQSAAAPAQAPAAPPLIAPMPAQPAPAQPAPAQPAPARPAPGKDSRTAPAAPPAAGSTPATGDVTPRSDDRSPQKPKDSGKVVGDALSGLATPPKGGKGIGEPRP
jgi:membrane-bound lytic murein transglycosylase B